MISKSGKRIEARVPDMKNPAKHYHKIMPEDVVLIKAVDENSKMIFGFPQLKYEVSFSRKYSNVEGLLEAEGLERVLPDIKTMRDGVKYIKSFPGYEERIKENGIYAIGLGKKL